MANSIQKSDFSYLNQLIVQVWKKKFQGRVPDPESASFSSEVNLLRDELQAIFPVAFRSEVNEGKGFQDNIRSVIIGELNINKLPTQRTIEVLSSYLYGFKPEDIDKWQKTFSAKNQYWNRFKKDLIGMPLHNNKFETENLNESNVLSHDQYKSNSYEPYVSKYEFDEIQRQQEHKVKLIRNKYRVLIAGNIILMFIAGFIYLSNKEYFDWLLSSEQPKHRLWVAEYGYKNEQNRDTTIYVFNTFRRYRDLFHVQNYFYSEELGDCDAFYFEEDKTIGKIRLDNIVKIKSTCRTTKEFTDKLGIKPPIKVRELGGI
mgnify:CR=1 FL=1